MERYTSYQWESQYKKRVTIAKTRALLKTWELVATKNGPTQSNILLDTKKSQS